jgi:hypothetical protein
MLREAKKAALRQLVASAMQGIAGKDSEGAAGG